MFDKLKDVRERFAVAMPLTKKALHLLFVIVLGAAMGFFAEYLEYYQYHAAPGSFFRSGFAQGLAGIGDRFAVWILAATLIAYLSRGPAAAGLHTPCFFVAMNTAYFIFKGQHYGYSIDGQFLFWSAIGLLSAGVAILIWYSRIGGWLGALIKASPIATILAEGAASTAVWIERSGSVYGSKLRYVLQPEHVTMLIFYILAAWALLIVLPKGAKERLRAGLLALALCPAVYAAFSLLYR